MISDADYEKLLNPSFDPMGDMIRGQRTISELRQTILDLNKQIGEMRVQLANEIGKNADIKRDYELRCGPKGEPGPVGYESITIVEEQDGTLISLTGCTPSGEVKTLYNIFKEGEDE